MRPTDSAYDRSTTESRATDPGAGRYALISDANGPCSLVGDYASLDDAIDAARAIMDTDAAPTDLEDEIGVDASEQTAAWLVAQAEAQGWQRVADAPAGEYWTVLHATPDADITVCGRTTEIDLSGQGHAWRVAADHELPGHIRTEIEGEIIDGGRETCADYCASNGLHYRWTE
jgi:hypothetical protein